MTITNMPLDELLDTKIRKLDLVVPSKYRDVMKVLYSLLRDKGIKWHPHIWASDEWFSPDGIDGFAIPFTLCHPRLIRLEKRILGYCEGESKREFLQLAAHETGHAIDNAFLLRKKKNRQKIFGLSSTKYPDYYIPRKNPDAFVTHLKDHYAQAHPEEDWAETFAVWLTQNYWKTKYRHSKALDKLEYVDELMGQIAGLAPLKTTKQRPLSYKQDDRTLREYFQHKKKQLQPQNYFHHKLDDYFSRQDGTSAYVFIKNNRHEILKSIKSSKSDFYRERCLEELARECRENKLRLNQNPQESIRTVSKIIERNLQSFVKTGQAKIYM